MFRKNIDNSYSNKNVVFQCFTIYSPFLRI